MDETRLEPTDLPDGGVFDSTTNRISFSNLSELSGIVRWDYYTEPADLTTGIRFGGLVKNSYNLVIPTNVTANYVDTDGNKISDDVVKSGYVGDAYSTDQAQTVTYVYTKNNVTPSTIPDNHSVTPESSKVNGNKNASTSENKNTFPQTEDNEVLSTFGIISGILLILGAISSILVKRKRED